MDSQAVVRNIAISGGFSSGSATKCAHKRFLKVAEIVPA